FGFSPPRLIGILTRRAKRHRIDEPPVNFPLWLGQAQIEFGNARTYYQDYVKFLLGNRYAGVGLGVLVVPSARWEDNVRPRKVGPATAG
ncbi:MAG: hypothetical protein ACP5R5_14310, partial [Armatimonadota bacterium]